MVWAGTGRHPHRNGRGRARTSGVFDVQTDAELQPGLRRHPAQIVNTGTFRKTAGSGAANPTDIGMPFDNDGAASRRRARLSLERRRRPEREHRHVHRARRRSSSAAARYDLGAGLERDGAGTVSLHQRHGQRQRRLRRRDDRDQRRHRRRSTPRPRHRRPQPLGRHARRRRPADDGGPGALELDGRDDERRRARRASAPAATLNLSGTNVKDIHSAACSATRARSSGRGTGHHPHRQRRRLRERRPLRHPDRRRRSTRTSAAVRLFVEHAACCGRARRPALDRRRTFTDRQHRRTIEALAGTLDLSDVFSNYNQTDRRAHGRLVPRPQRSCSFNERGHRHEQREGRPRHARPRGSSRPRGDADDGLRNFADNAAAGRLLDHRRPRTSSRRSARGPNLTNSGVLRGTGTYFQNVTNNGTVAPGASPGILTIDGDYTQSPAGTLEIEVGGDWRRREPTSTASSSPAPLRSPGRSPQSCSEGSRRPRESGSTSLTAATQDRDVQRRRQRARRRCPADLLPEARYDLTTVKLFAVPGGGAADTPSERARATKSVTVTLSAASSEEITVGYATADGTALAGSDYQPRRAAR